MQTVDFVQTLMELRGGAAAADCSRKLSELVAAIQETGKKGKLVLEINVAPAKLDMGKVREVDVSHSCKIAKPEHDSGRSIFFLTDSGELTRQDPNQMGFTLEEVEEERSK